jgi:hypothetical protein
MECQRTGGHEFYDCDSFLCCIWVNHIDRGKLKNDSCEKKIYTKIDCIFDLFNQVLMIDDRNRSGSMMVRPASMNNRFGESIPDYEEVKVCFYGSLTVKLFN